MPMIAAMSYSRLVDRRHILNMRNTYTNYETVNDEEVELLRNTGSSLSIVRSALSVSGPLYEEVPTGHS